MPFHELAVVVAAGLLGPLIAASSRRAPPAVIGQLAAGYVIGPSVLGWIDPAGPLLDGLAAVGLALLMFVVGTHLPVRDPHLRGALAKGLATAATALALGGAVAALVVALTPLDRPLLVVVLVTTSSAAVALPILQEVEGEAPLHAIAWIAAADVLTVLLLPLAVETGSVGRVLLGAGLVGLAGVGLYLAGRAVAPLAVVARLRHRSRERGWGLDLRVSLLGLFAVAWLASDNGTSILLAGFAVGAVVSLLGEPRRVADQLIGVGEGFAIPLFFVVLGARIDFGELLRSPGALGLAALLALGAVVVHVVVAVIWRVEVAIGLVAVAQLGVPAAATSIGLSTGALSQAEAAAVTAAMAVTLLVCSVGATLLGHPGHLTDGRASG